MMHGHEKSDSAIVAMKPPNKAGRPAAEAVERRAEAKENANRCRTCRTQCRESVSPTPERVRKAEASRQTSEVGAVCRKAARTVLCGGRPVMGVPTAIARRNQEIQVSRWSSTDLVYGTVARISAEPSGRHAREQYRADKCPVDGEGPSREALEDAQKAPDRDKGREAADNEADGEHQPAVRIEAGVS